MKDPYEVFGLSSDADEETIRQRYLTLVREHSPERDPEGFAEIRVAYDQLRDPLMNLQRQLFTLTAHETLDNLAAAAADQVGQQRISTPVLLSLADG